MSVEEQGARGRSGVEEHPTYGGVEIPHGDPVVAHHGAHGSSIHLPAPTSYPIVTALGFSLLVSGILTHYVISILGAMLLVYGCVGWFRDVLPHEEHEDVEVRVQEVAIASSRKSVARIPVDEIHRAQLPVHSFSVLIGLRGGIAGGIAMIVPALAYGLIAQHSLWYPINLLGGAGVAASHNPTMADLRAFHASWFGVAILIHVISCTLIGLLYGAVLPLMPKRPVLLGGILAPLAWTGLLFATLPTINPEMAQHINWWAFLISQLTFGIVAGLVVSRSPYVRTARTLPLALRMGLEGGGLGHGSHGDDTNGNTKERH
jgi:hypothetical protein